ncbi:hypothetical protein FRC09_003536 [Ceratobasidium sp. 395]|nr:hypothetical protein FRC09_003536 [Ceratobasidium sp. 395]
MSLLLPRNYSTGLKSKMRESPDPLEPELAPEEEPSTPLFKSVEVQADPAEAPENAPKSECQDPVVVEEKVVDSESSPQVPLDPNAKYEQSLKKAQDEWARRRKAGFEDYGAEMAKDAKIWQIYVRETDKADEELVDGWNKSLDVLLNLMVSKSSINRQAALFSAISTAFVGMSAQNLQRDPSDTSAQALLVISRTLLAMSGGGATNTSLSGLEQVTTGFRPSPTAVAVNALWFLSLSLSVAVSLIAMLAKEWCYSFMSGRSGETYERARLRQKRWNEIERLRMIDVLTLLPLLMHLALHWPTNSPVLTVLFAVGLCIYLWDLNIAVAIPVVAITSISMVIYASTIIHSLTAEHCPYTTASSKLAKAYIKAWLNSPASFLHDRIKVSFAHLRLSIAAVADPLKAVFLKAKARLQPWTGRYDTYFEPQSRALRLAAFISSRVRTLRTTWLRPFHRKVNESHSMDVEDYLARDEGMDITTSQMLSWLLVNCQDSRVTEPLVFALAGAEPWLPRLPLLEGNALSIVFRFLDKYFQQNLYRHPYRLRPSVSPDMASLCLRALQFLLGYYNGHGFVLYVEPKVVMKNTWSRDFYVGHLGEMAAGIEREG